MNDYTSIADLYDSYVTDTRDHAFWSRRAAEATGPILELTAGTGRATVALRRASGRLVAPDLAESEQTYRVLGVGDQVLEDRRLTLRFVLLDAVSLVGMAAEAGLQAQALFGDYDESPYAPGSSPFILAVLGRA